MVAAMELRFPDACFRATSGMSITETELVIVDGKKIRGIVIPVRTP